MSASPTCSVSSRAVPEVSAGSAVTVRTTGDRCPGAMRLHEAADGPLARIRIPGGLLSTDAALALADLAESVGDGHLHLTVRGNVELRGIQCIGVTGRQCVQCGTGVELSGIEEVRTGASRLQRERAEAQRLHLQCQLHEARAVIRR